MIRKSICILGMALAFNASSLNVEAGTLMNEKTPLIVDTCDNSELCYEIGDTAAIIRDGMYAGYLRINSIQKLGIYDWYNSVAVANDVTHSYAINVSVNLTKALGNSPSILIKPSCSIMSNNEITGKDTNLGWSGYPRQIALYGEQGEVTFETVVQPTSISGGEQKLILSFQEQGHTIEDIVFSAKELEGLDEVVSLKKPTEPTQIKSVNGGVYTFSVDSVTLSSNKFKLDEDGRKHNQLVYDVKMRIRYDKIPTNKMLYTRYDSDTLMSTSIFFGIQSDLGTELLYDSDNSLLEKRAVYKEDSTGEQYFAKYTYEKYANLIENLKVGEVVEITFNRVIGEDTQQPQESVRVLFEFPEEVKDKDSFKTFNGRYVVYEVPVQWEEELNVEE